MKTPNVVRLLILFAVVLAAADFAAAQCGTFFKDGYRKILNDFSDFQVADWNNDGRDDFWKFQLNPNTNTQIVYIYLNDGNGNFVWENPLVTQTAIPVIRPNLDSFELIDYNGDGKKDFFVSQGNTDFTVHQNNGNNTFTALATNVFSGETSTSMIRSFGFIDVNSDNRLDWLRVIRLGTSGQRETVYRIGNPDGTFGAPVVIYGGSASIASVPVIGDFNGDGRKDIAEGSSAFLFTLFNNGDGTFTEPAAGTSQIGFRNNNVTIRDFNADGRDDIVVTENTSVGSQVTRTIITFLANADGTFTGTRTNAYQLSGPPEWQNAGLVAGEFNGDNFPDLIEIASLFYSVHINNGNGTFARTDYKRIFGLMQNFVFGKFNGDNKTDIYVRSYSTVPLSNVFGERIISIRYNQCAASGETKRANFDGDRLGDVVKRNTSTNQWQFFDTDTNTLDNSPATFTWGTASAGDVPALGDYDGDGKTDAAVFRPSNGTWYIRQSADNSSIAFPFGAPGDIAVPGDYDGGGKTDLAVFRPSDGNWYIWSMEYQQFTAVHFGATGDKPVMEDYDGDGKTDIAVYRPSNGGWYILKSADNSFAAVGWGIASDKPLPADYDGDGKADIAVYRDGAWYILRSLNGALAVLNWGTATDAPAALYRLSEAAVPYVYRPSSYTWYHYQGATYTFGDSQTSPVFFGQPNS